ncbi:hypothetical protein ACRQ5D_24950 [Mucilaginibacter sp. P25]|uniref:Uncharacterized protein n=1 Tax=Mucilaginibacter gossypii TaxID=551996 RepID=A0A1G7TN08_9SPHI|nr:hypothetical protein [Mucilaginibacter gossypii]SDG36069.1 hypothetical protein SAMN05192573_103197 [Mucilaginibacter gossypii]
MNTMMSDPSDEAIVYFIFSTNHGVKATLINGYDTFSKSLTEGLVNELKEKRNKNI